VCANAGRQLGNNKDTIDAVIEVLQARRRKTTWSSDAKILALAIQDVEALR
jgi:hypothetical protein